MIIREMNLNDISNVVDIYIEYYNKVEHSCWDEDKVFERIEQVLTTKGSYTLIMEENGNACGFAMGYFKQYDDIVGYVLEEIVIKRELQNQGLGSKLMAKLDEYVISLGASCIELKAVNDEKHLHFYNKAGFVRSNSFVNMVKWY